MKAIRIVINEREFDIRNSSKFIQGLKKEFRVKKINQVVYRIDNKLLSNVFNKDEVAIITLYDNSTYFGYSDYFLRFTPVKGIKLRLVLEDNSRVDINAMLKLLISIDDRFHDNNVYKCDNVDVRYFRAADSLGFSVCNRIEI